MAVAQKYQGSLKVVVKQGVELGRWGSGGRRGGRGMGVGVEVGVGLCVTVGVRVAEVLAGKQASGSDFKETR